MDKKNNAPRKSARNARKAEPPASRQAFINETDAMHAEALAQIKARGENPQQILRDIDSA